MLSFIDLDKYIETEYRKTIQEIFSEKGEDKFRIIEREMLREVSTFQNVLISTGGGTLVSSTTEVMNRRGITVYVKASLNNWFTFGGIKNVRPIIRNKISEELKQFVKSIGTSRKLLS